MKTERKKIRPDYYDEFSCIAGQCPITCCQEWKIAVDADTNRRWKKVPPPDTMPGCAKIQSLDQVSGDSKNCGKNLSTYTCMKDGIRVIRLDEEHRCPFLAKDKLCRLVLAYGDSILLETCTTFPREVHRFADHEEDTLMPECPAVIDLWRHKEITFPSVVHSNADISSENTWTNVSEHTMCVEKDENKMAFLIREHILALLGDHTVSIEEALLESFYILLELYKNQSVTPELVEEYFSPEILLQLRTAITQAKSTISSLETWEECNELLQDLAVNYRKEGLYEKFLTPVITQAEYYSQIFGRQGIHVGEDMDATKGENEAGQLWDRWRQFRNAFASYELLLRNFLRNEVFSDLILPENFVKAFEGRIINIHPSLIPSHCGAGYYGLKVHESVLARGNKVTGATVHFVDEGTDSGPIISQKAVEVLDDDTPEVLQKRVMEQAEWKILPEAIDLIANGKLEIVDGIVKRK